MPHSSWRRSPHRGLNRRRYNARLRRTYQELRIMMPFDSSVFQRFAFPASRASGYTIEHHHQRRSRPPQLLVRRVGEEVREVRAGRVDPARQPAPLLRDGPSGLLRMRHRVEGRSMPRSVLPIRGGNTRFGGARRGSGGGDTRLNVGCHPGRFGAVSGRYQAGYSDGIGRGTTSGLNWAFGACSASVAALYKSLR